MDRATLFAALESMSEDSIGSDDNSGGESSGPGGDGD
jgi:hypothetical protein